MDRSLRSPNSCHVFLASVIVAEHYLGWPQEEVKQEQQHKLPAQVDERGGVVWWESWKNHHNNAQPSASRHLWRRFIQPVGRDLSFVFTCLLLLNFLDCKCPPSDFFFVVFVCLLARLCVFITLIKRICCNLRGIFFKQKMSVVTRFRGFP